MPRFGDGFMSTELPITCEVALMQFVIQPSSGVCRKNEYLSANSVMLCVSVVKLPGKTFTTEARSLRREPRRTFSDRLLQTARPKIHSPGCSTPFSAWLLCVMTKQL